MEVGGLSSASVGAAQTLASLQLWAVAALLKWGCLVGVGFWLPPCSMALQSQLLMGCLWGSTREKLPGKMAANGREDDMSQTKLADEIFVLR